MAYLQHPFAKYNTIDEHYRSDDMLSYEYGYELCVTKRDYKLTRRKMASRAPSRHPALLSRPRPLPAPVPSITPPYSSRYSYE